MGEKHVIFKIFPNENMLVRAKAI